MSECRDGGMNTFLDEKNVLIKPLWVYSRIIIV